MVLADSIDSFFNEVEQMFALCKERGAGTVYTTLKKVEQPKKKGKPEPAATSCTGGGRKEGWLARAKISNKKARKISTTVRAKRMTVEASAAL